MRRKNLLWTCLIATLLIGATLTVTVTFAAAAKLDAYPPLVEDIYPDDPDPTFTINITISNVNNLYGWEFTLSFNPSVLEVATHNETHQIPGTDPPIYYNETVNNVYEGPFLESSGYEATFYPQVNNVSGDVNAFSMLKFDEETGAWPPTGATGSGLLATIEFRVIGYGVCVLDLHDTELDTVVGTPPNQYVDYIAHTAADSLFDNRLANELPVASFDVTHPGMIMPVVGQPITFDASASYDPDGWLVSHAWDFGDGTTDSGKVVKHIFAKVGTYTVSLTVSDNDDEPDSTSCTTEVVEWMEGGEFPDILDAWPERYEWNEGSKGRELKLFGLVGNPTNDTFEVYVVFTVFHREDGAKLGTINTAPVTLTSGEERKLSATMDLRDTRWRVMRPHWTYWSNARISVNHKYEVFATCYYRPVASGDFKKGFAAIDFGFKVLGAKHDVAILGVTTNATGDVQRGDFVEIYVTIDNLGGNYDETVNIVVKYKGLTMSGTVGTRTVLLKQQEKKTETFILNTSNLDKGAYLILTNLTPLTYEEDLIDNLYKDCRIYIRWAHDVRVASVTPLNETVEPGETALINVEVTNEGMNTENFTVTTCYDDVTIGTQTVANLVSGGTKTLTFGWDTTGVAKGEYTIKAEASLAPEMFPSDNVLVDGTIKVTKRPVASFTISPSPPYNVNQTLTFDASASYDPDGTITSYEWNFGDGNVTTVTVPIITHNYTSIGTYTVTLTVTDDIGVTSTATRNVTALGHDIEVTSVTAYPSLVKPGESVSITVTVTNVGNFKENFRVTVYANTTEIGTEAIRKLGPGGTETLTFVWDTTAKGYYVIKANASAVPDEVDITNNVGSCVVNVRWAHDIRVVSVTPSKKAVEPGETALVYVTVANDGTNTESFKVTVYANTTMIGANAINALRVGGTETLTFEWNTIGVAKGEYTIKAEASLAPDVFPSDNVLVDGTIKVTKLPVANFTISPSPPYNVNQTLTFNATTSSDPDGTIVSYFWDFGDGTNATGIIVDHAYDEAGKYTVTLKVTDDIGVTNIATMVVTIEETP